jgi:hypothetical protein
MYSFLDITLIFLGCKNWNDLERACEAFMLVLKDGEMPPEIQCFILEQSQIRFRELESL